MSVSIFAVRSCGTPGSDVDSGISPIRNSWEFPFGIPVSFRCGGKARGKANEDLHH